MSGVITSRSQIPPAGRRAGGTHKNSPSATLAEEDHEPRPRGKREADFNPLVLCNSRDSRAVHRITDRLRAHGLEPWLADEQLRPGLDWQKAIEEKISTIPSLVLFIGPSGVGPWQNHEIRAVIAEFVRRGCPVIPVLLRDCPSDTPIPPFLSPFGCVDFRDERSAPLQRLIWGITGVPPIKRHAHRLVGDHGLIARSV